MERSDAGKKVCIICWNDERWQRPTRRKIKHSGFVGDHDFGHEEWLNRTDWVLRGYDGSDDEYHYAHLQGVLTPNNKYKGEILDILLCSRSPESKWLAVGRISRAVVLDKEEAFWASKRIIENGWLQTMRHEVLAVGGSDNALPALSWDGMSGKYNSFELTNVKYRPDDIEFFQAFRPFSPKGKRQGTPYKWDGIIPDAEVEFAPLAPPSDETEGSLRIYSEAIQVRRRADGKDVTPRQSKIQNKLSKMLHLYLKKNSSGKVFTEYKHVDVAVILRDKRKIYIEIKCSSSVRMAICLAIGQLMDYAHYPSDTHAEKLVIITDQRAEDDDYKYMAWIRKRYNINMHLMVFEPSKVWDENNCAELLRI